MKYPGEFPSEQIPPEPMERLLEVCLLNAEKTDEGNKGIILEVDISSLPSEWQAQFMADGEILSGDSLAIKVIKIFLPRKIEHEAHMQKMASDIITDQPNQDDFAKVPHAYQQREIAIHNTQLLSKLKSWGVNVMGDQVGMMVMDFIQGEDLATHLYKHVVKHDHRLRDLKQRTENGERLNFADIRDRVQVALGFERPPNQADQASEFILEAANMDRLFVALKRYGFKLDPKILDKLQNTIKLLHEHDIYHNDLHERNIVLKLDTEGQIADVYIVDFDRALDIEDISVAGRDSDVINRYRAFVDKPEAEQTIDESKWLSGVEHFQDRFRDNRAEKMRLKWGDFERRIKELLSLDSPNRLKLLADEIYIEAYSLVQSDDWCKLAGSVILEINKLEQEQSDSTNNRKEKILPPLARLLAQNFMERQSTAYTQNFWRQFLGYL